jgi:hypothetical protein
MWMTVIHEERKNQPASKRLPLPGTRMALLVCSWWPLLSLLSDGTRKLDLILNMFLLFIAKEMCIS